jgi:hypothetical protein
MGDDRPERVLDETITLLQELRAEAARCTGLAEALAEVLEAQVAAAERELAGGRGT